MTMKEWRSWGSAIFRTCGSLRYFLRHFLVSSMWLLSRCCVLDRWTSLFWVCSNEFISVCCVFRVRSVFPPLNVMFWLQIRECFTLLFFCSAYRFWICSIVPFSSSYSQSWSVNSLCYVFIRLTVSSKCCFSCCSDPSSFSFSISLLSSSCFRFAIFFLFCTIIDDFRFFICISCISFDNWCSRVPCSFQMTDFRDNCVISSVKSLTQQSLKRLTMDFWTEVRRSQLSRESWSWLRRSWLRSS